MIYNQWYIVLESKELKKDKPLKIKRFNEDLVIWRNDYKNISCIQDRCCHRGASLSCGKIKNGEIECPFHGFLYNKSGKVTVIPANGKSSRVMDSMKVKSYEVYEDFGFIWLWFGDNKKINSKPFYFNELKDFSCSGFKDNWAVHYSRAIENQLDVVHLPFVHKTTIGKGNKTLVNGPVVIREEELITFYVNNVVDDGRTKPLKPDEITNYKDLFFLKFHYPNVWQNYISDKVRVMAAFVPVDEGNSIIYIRFYQRLFKIPVIKHLINYLGKIFSIIILRQDKRVVITQIPKKSKLNMDENLIIGDKPIIEYRMHREELIEQNKNRES
jgi:phenylpropionate dioxygenase-like ring-hydroxylating dioxygenase large terminal subunit